jgi:4-carboxymuconolactone decarboxylase
MTDDESVPGDATHRARAEVSWREVMRFEPVASTDPYSEFTLDHVFGRIWTRGGLARRDRRLVTLTVVAMSGQSMPLSTHLAAALRSGDLTADELHEWVLHLAHYAGWPVAATAYVTLREVEAEIGAEPSAAGTEPSEGQPEA